MSADETCFMCDLEPDYCAHVIAEADRSVCIIQDRETHRLVIVQLTVPFNADSYPGPERSH